MRETSGALLNVRSHAAVLTSMAVCSNEKVQHGTTNGGKRSVRAVGQGSCGSDTNSRRELIMQPLVYRDAHRAEVANVRDARIGRATEVLVSITSTNICGSDFQIYEGRAPLDPATAIGRENLGQVIPTGDAVVKVRVGDTVSVPFNIACGFCGNCERGITGFCTIRGRPCPSARRPAATRC